MINTKRIKEKIAYRFDTTLTKGIGSLIWWLALTTIIIVIAITILVWTLNLATDNSFADQFWFFLLRSIGDDYYVKTPWMYRMLYLIIVFSSIFITSVLISILTQIIQSRVEELRKGHSKIIEKKHTVILGWSPKIYTILKEFDVSAIDEKKNKVVVVLGNKDKVLMEDEILRNTKNVTHQNLQRTKVICRTGDPTNKGHLDILNLIEAEAIIVLTEENDRQDTEIIKTLLALKGYIIANKQKYKLTLETIFQKTITQINDEKNKKIADIITKNTTKLIRIKEFTAKIIAQTARQSGLPRVYEELFDFHGMEIYFIKNQIDLKYEELLTYYEDISIIGYMDKDNNYYLNPDNKDEIKKSETLIVISGSVSKANIRKKSNFNPTVEYDKKQAENIIANDILILGWNKLGNAIVEELESYVKNGNKQEITIIPKGNIKTFNLNFNSDKLQVVSELEHDYSDYKYLVEILKLRKFRNIIILSDEELDVQDSDVKNITILHFIRDIEQTIKENHENFSIDVVCQLLDEKNQELISDFHKNDFVVSAKLASLFFSQISQEFRLFKVFDEILDEKGSEIYIKKATNYFKEGTEVTYAEIIRAASRRDETVIGYESNNRQVTELNLPKSKKITINNSDRIILLEKTEFKENSSL